ERGKRRRFQVATAGRLHLETFLQRPRSEAGSDGPEHRVAARRVVMARLADCHERRQGIADHGKPKPVEGPVRTRGELEWQLRTETPRFTVGSQPAGQCQHGEYRGGERPVLSVPPDNRGANPGRAQLSDLLLQPPLSPCSGLPLLLNAGWFKRQRRPAERR